MDTGLSTSQENFYIMFEHNNVHYTVPISWFIAAAQYLKRLYLKVPNCEIFYL